MHRPKLANMGPFTGNQVTKKQRKHNSTETVIKLFIVDVEAWKEFHYNQINHSTFIYIKSFTSAKGDQSAI